MWSVREETKKKKKKKKWKSRSSHLLLFGQIRPLRLEDFRYSLWRFLHPLNNRLSTGCCCSSLTFVRFVFLFFFLSFVRFTQLFVLSTSSVTSCSSWSGEMRACVCVFSRCWMGEIWMSMNHLGKENKQHNKRTDENFTKKYVALRMSSIERRWKERNLLSNNIDFNSSPQQYSPGNEKHLKQRSALFWLLTFLCASKWLEKKNIFHFDKKSVVNSVQTETNDEKRKKHNTVDLDDDDDDRWVCQLAKQRMCAYDCQISNKTKKRNLLKYQHIPMALMNNRNRRNKFTSCFYSSLDIVK